MISYIQLNLLINSVGDELAKIKSKKIIIADLGLALVAVLWGGGFVAVKDAVNDVAPFI